MPSLLDAYSLLYHLELFKGARSPHFSPFCLILLFKSSERQIGRAGVFYLQNHGHITIENDFAAVLIIC